MQVNNFIVGVGPNSEVAQRILYNAMQKQWRGADLMFYYHGIMQALAAGKDIETAITETEFVLIITNVHE